ncbi:AAA family ATPase, partial [Streptomyces sp. NRRL S-495]|uniref:AAA family ATPase n=1 Tax=Streptomyces sp. NRRL S-495 TaxID=1609133 RepID=UPI000B031B28
MPYIRAAPAPLSPPGHASPPVLTPASVPRVPTAETAQEPAPARLPNGDPMLATRVRPPRPPAAFLRRDRLLGRLDAAALRPVTLVNGPAGAGKTLLVADWLARGRLPGPAGWLTLEPSDNQPGTFWAYVREALQTGVAGLPAEVGAPARAEHVEPSLLLRLAAWINARPRPVVLVLDECEHLDNLRLAEQLHDLVRHTAGRLRLVLVGRSEPLLPLHRYRAAGELAEIRAGELALDRAETAAVLGRHGLRVGPAAVGAVHHALSGWTAGVRLLALAAQDADDPEAYLGRIDAGPAALSDFLLAEVLRSQPAPTQDLLLRCSILGRVHPDLADALTGRRDGRRILDRLHQDNAFTDALPDGWYRLHPMFAGILRLHLRAAAPERVDELRVRAAHWLAGHGQYRAALDHAAEPGAWPVPGRAGPRGRGRGLGAGRAAAGRRVRPRRAAGRARRDPAVRAVRPDAADRARPGRRTGPRGRPPHPRRGRERAADPGARRTAAARRADPAPAGRRPGAHRRRPAARLGRARR